MASANFLNYEYVDVSVVLVPTQSPPWTADVNVGGKMKDHPTRQVGALNGPSFSTSAILVRLIPVLHFLAPKFGWSI